MAERMTKSLWLPFGVSPDADVRLLLLPHAGAGATVYRAWAAGLPPYVGLCPVQPPGREKRRSEPPLRTVQGVVAQLAPEVLAMVRPPYALFGHSTGALCAFELTRAIRAMGGAGPVHLFVSGRRAPQLPMQRTELDGLSVDELTIVLRRLGGTPEEILANRDVLRMIQPVLTADFSINEDYTYQPERPLSVPITSFAATHDAGANLAQLAAWEEQTTAEFRLLTITGGHFAIFDRAPEVRDRIAEALRRWS
jgi:medium-chain acyl-[acyl-carrier-protein] hydrolase